MSPQRRQTASLAASPIAQDVRAGLSATPKWLPAYLFYDAAGSQLFVEITRLPEYYPTRTEQAILDANAEEIIHAAGPGVTLVELGAGTASKTRTLIAATLRRQLSAGYYPIDVSTAALREAKQHLTNDFPGLRVTPILGDYAHGLEQVRQIRGRKLVLFIGSSIGNYEPRHAEELLRAVRAALTAGDALLLGTDMVKEPAVLRAAYNDAQGVTARFNLNLLRRINRELGGTFDPAAFRHEAVWNARNRRIEMYLVSTRAQRVWIKQPGEWFSFRQGERIHTENSYKFKKLEVRRMLERSGFRPARHWTDERQWYTVHLAQAK